MTTASVWDDIRSWELGRYHHPQKLPLEVWYQCPLRKCEVNLVFECWYQSSNEIVAALKYAYNNHANGVRITRLNISDDFKDFQYTKIDGRPLQFAFNSDYHAVQYEDLTPIADGEITNNVHIVTYQNIQYVHKFMWRQSYQASFEKEVERYIRLRECDGVLQLKAVVIRNGVVQGLLIPYIEGEDLWAAAITSESELLNTTYRIIQIAAGLENAGFYHEDLKCQNIVRRRSDGGLYFIDFAGGLTDGFYREESINELADGNVNATEGMYVLGKTLWQLWTKKHPKAEDQLAEQVPEPACSIIYDCVEYNVDTIDKLRRKYCIQ
jgi:tRNA A-37 threonylcarbamoyl transferase component Bud32